MTKEQTDLWEKTIRQVRKLVDGFGMPVDEEIVETVAILKLMGINTTMSCGGHLSRITGGPYVMFASKKAARYRKLCQEIGNPADPDYKDAAKRATCLNILERQKLWQFLDDFYKDRITPNDQRLIMQTPVFTTRLNCLGADLAYILSVKAKREMLMRHRAEMQAFTNYLKHHHFGPNA